MITAEQVRMARAGLRMRTRDLAEAAGVSPNTVTRIEAGLAGNQASLSAVCRALESAGARFVEPDSASCGVVLPRGAGRSEEPEGLRPEDLNASNDG